MVKIFELDRKVNTQYKDSSGLLLSNYIYQANRQFIETPESTCKRLSRNSVQHSNTPVLQHSNTPVLQYSSTPTLRHLE
jgi:hypothetical protein